MKRTALLYILVLNFAVICVAQSGLAQLKDAVRAAPKKGYSALGLNFIIAIEGVAPADPTIWNSGPLLGEIKLIAGEVAPKGWALCTGQLMLIQHNPALFSLLGTRFGGDGKLTFALPNLKDAIPVGVGEIWQSGNRIRIE